MMSKPASTARRAASPYCFTTMAISSLVYSHSGMPTNGPLGTSFDGA